MGNMAKNSDVATKRIHQLENYKNAPPRGKMGNSYDININKYIYRFNLLTFKSFKHLSKKVSSKSLYFFLVSI